jgi:aconitase A
MGLPEEDFNSYATHRGDHLTAQRATFANPKLINEMAVVDGKVKQGRWHASNPKARSRACGKRSRPTWTASSR